jgi:hypothetical protein
VFGFRNVTAGAKAQRNFNAYGTTEQAAEKLASSGFPEGRSFSCAVQVVYFCHPERTLVREGSAFQALSAASEVVP